MYNLYERYRSIIIKITCDDTSLLCLDIVKDFGSNNANNVCFQVAKELKKYFSIKNYNFKVKIKLNGTEFQKKVWKEVLKIPYGKTISYEDIAIKLGSKNKARAVANAIGKNNILIVVPCHRVIRKNGKLASYKAGIKHKEMLLNYEG